MKEALRVSKKKKKEVIETFLVMLQGRLLCNGYGTGPKCYRSSCLSSGCGKNDSKLLLDIPEISFISVELNGFRKQDNVWY